MIDMEHAFDPDFASKLGVNIDELYISQPEHLQECFTIIDQFVDAGCDLIVLDSIATLVPKEELEGDVGKQTIGLVARYMGQFLRRIGPKLSQNNVCLICINQTRDNVGILYGCLHGETLVNFTDGRSIPIKEVVENKIKGNVWSYNEKTNTFEEKEIIDWHFNGKVEKTEDYIHFITESIKLKDEITNGNFGFTVTPNHLVMTQKGWKQAKDITLQDKLLSKYYSTINGILADFLYGTVIGDCTIQKRNTNTACLHFQDNINLDYINWKISKLSPFFNFKAHNKGFTSEYTYELSLLKNEIQERNPNIMLKDHFSNLGLALWYMDDGHYDNKDGHNRIIISCKRLVKTPNLLDEIVKNFKNCPLNIECNCNKNNGSLYFSTENSQKIFNAIAKYIPECMQYKLPKEYQNQYVDFILANKTILKETYVNIKKIEIASDKQLRMKGKYDLTIKDTENYSVGGVNNGIIVHNSPTTTPGGKLIA